ncbi:uncharacterized protein, partial [Lepeophtheirus salmonis]|uniref:uncharacterized protein n=1 Tax=Lepeophtheirus salmonis TaxID=72036 RepID=UPI003AF38F07
MILKKEEVCKQIGVNLSIETIEDYLRRMMHKVKIINDNTVEVSLQYSRKDVLHPIDLIEDIAISYGYDNIPEPELKINTTGKQLFINKVVDFLRYECANWGYVEVMNFVLLSREDFLKTSGNSHNTINANNSAINSNITTAKDNNTNNICCEKLGAVVSNPKSKECEITRNNLLAGLLKTIRGNRHVGGDVKIFETGDVIVPNNLEKIITDENFNAIYDKDDDFINVKHISGLIASSVSSFDKVQEKRSADILANNHIVGKIGIIYPKILESFKVNK